MNAFLSKRIMSDEDYRWFIGLAVIACLALFLRILSWEFFAYAEAGVPLSDARTLDTMANNILDGIGYQDRVAYWLYQAFRMPFFSLFLASIYAVFGYDYFPAKVILCGISVLTCLSAAGVGRILFNRSVGFVAGLFFAAYYPLIFLSHAFMTETLSFFLFIQGIYMFLRALHERSCGFIVGSAIVLTLSVLTRFAFVAVLPVLFIYLLASSTSWKRKIKMGSLWIVVIMATFSPWIIRNALVLDTFFPSASGGTRMFWTGTNPKFDGVTFSAEAWRDILWADPDASEVDRTKRIKKEAIEYIKNNTSWYMAKIAWRANYHLKIPGIKDLKKGANNYVVWTKVCIFLAAWLGTIGIFLAIFKKPRAGLFLAAIFTALLSLHSIAGEEIRYRLAAECIWILGAAYAFISLLRLTRQSFFDIDSSASQPVKISIFDYSIVQKVVPVVLILPFVILAIRVPINRELKSLEKLPVLQRSVESVLVENGHLDEFRNQGGSLNDISHYKNLAFSQSPKDGITYPYDIVVFAGELSHFIFDDNRKIIKFSLNVNKAGLYGGDARLQCFANEKRTMILPAHLKEEKRTQGIVVGKVLSAGPLGDIVISVSDIIVNNMSLKER